MNPIYKFELTAGNTTQRAYPIYKDDLAKDFEKESGQEFFRAKLSGNLTFESDDYMFIVSQAFDTQFVLEIFISTNAGISWASYWRGTFWKTDCEFDADTQTVSVKPTVLDQYNDILAGLDKEYNLIELAPEIVPVKADKRPMIQVYVPGQSVVGCFLSGMWWEQEAEPESDETKLVNAFHFSLNKSLLIADVSGTTDPELPDILTGVITGSKFDGNTQGVQDFVNGDYTLRYQYQAGGGGSIQAWYIIRNSDSTILWENVWTGVPQLITLPLTVTLTPQNGATGNVTLYIHETPVYSRFVCDTEEINGISTYPIPADDIVENNRNYTRVIGYYFPDTIAFSNRLTETPTQWGLYQPNEYYQQPYSLTSQEFFPVARNAWGRVSIWFTFSAFDWLVEESGRQPFTIRHAYPLWSVLQVLLNKVAPNVVFRANYTCSQFFYPYDTNPITGLDFRLFITPKSNIVTAGYDQPAQKAPITLRNVFDMLRDCFRCYWFVDDSDRLHIEHIQYFRNGGSYDGSPVVGIDLTTQQVPRNGKPWAFGRDQFKFDKPEMAARYQFGWMDDVTQLFDGFPIDVVSKYVNPDNIEQIDVSKFTSDIDYILLNPGEISKDGFVLLAAKYTPGQADTNIDLTTQSLKNYNISPSTLNWGTNSSYKHVRIQLTAGQKIRLTSNANNPARIAWLTNNDNATSGGTVPYVSGTSLISQDANTTVEYTVPGYGTVYMYIYIGASSSNPSYRPTSLVVLGYPEEHNLPYVNIQYNNTDHILQNAYVAFCLLQQYYAYDMPAPDYKINGVQMVAQGIKKLKEQTIRFPVLTDPDLVELVKTNLGNGVIEKLSINLSSRNANATLKYDTE